MSESKKKDREIRFLEYHDYQIIDDNFIKIWNEIGEKLKNEKIKGFSTT